MGGKNWRSGMEGEVGWRGVCENIGSGSRDGKKERSGELGIERVLNESVYLTRLEPRILLPQR